MRKSLMPAYEVHSPPSHMRQTCQRVQHMCHHYVPVPVVPAVFQGIINGIKTIPSLLWQLRAMRDKVLHLCTEWKTPLEPIGAASRILQCSRLDHGL
ncbi:hypothetical protein NC653_027364 [Populus alba x Populus x berolinensis]|uniref:Uncharacterized protein n=1 Tax=Populus alba x Populus x berolinensis TaxID=444605 RepID=A0AAD6M532_9ROSI|nr:hypothetical protein NC653_027364 [Populus alba x Populus x berolinensis]